MTGESFTKFLHCSITINQPGNHYHAICFKLVICLLFSFYMPICLCTVESHVHEIALLILDGEKHLTSNVVHVNNEDVCQTKAMYLNRALSFNPTAQCTLWWLALIGTEVGYYLLMRVQGRAMHRHLFSTL